MKPPPGVISVADHTGWAHLVCVSVQGGLPVVVERRRVSLIEPGLPTLPYEHDTVAMREDEAEALIARVRRSIAACTTRALERVVSELAPTCAVVALAIRKPPFPRIPSSVRAVHASYQLKCSADGMLYQGALCRAAKRQGLEVRLCRRGEEVELAAKQPWGAARRGRGVRDPCRPPGGSAVDPGTSAGVRGGHRRAGASRANAPARTEESDSLRSATGNTRFLSQLSATSRHLTADGVLSRVVVLVGDNAR